MKTTRSKMFRDGLTKLISGVALASATFLGNAEAPVQQSAQQDEPTLEEKVKNEKYVSLKKWSSCWTCKGNCPDSYQCSYRFRAGHLDVDNSNNVYITDELNYSVKKFDMYGNLIKEWGSRGEGDGEFMFPVGIAVDDGFVFVSEQGNASGDERIQKFDLDGNFIKKWYIDAVGNSGTGDLDVDSFRNIYINVVGGTLVKKFDSEGNFIKEWETGVRGDPKGFNGIAVDKNDNIYVPGLNKIKKFSLDGEFIMEFDPGFWAGGIAIDDQDNLYITDSLNNYIQKFDSDGNFITKFGKDSDPEFEWPRGIVVDNRGFVYIGHFDDYIKKFVKLPVVGIERESDTVTMSFESPPSSTHRVFRSSDLKNWEQINVLKSFDYQNWTDVNKFYSNGQRTLLRDPKVPTTQTFYKVSVQEPDFRVVDGIEYCLETDKLAYHRGEKVDLVYRVTNYREEPFYFKSQAVFTAEKDGKYYYYSFSGNSFSLAHGESKEIFPTPWIIRDDEKTGRYNATAGIQNYLTGDTNFPVTTTIDVIESKPIPDE